MESTLASPLVHPSGAMVHASDVYASVALLLDGKTSGAMTGADIPVTGGHGIPIAIVLLMVMIYLFLLCDLVIAHWSNELSINPQASARPYLSAYVFWLGMSLTFWVMGWRQGQAFTMRLSAAIHDRDVGIGFPDSHTPGSSGADCDESPRQRVMPDEALSYNQSHVSSERTDPSQFSCFARMGRELDVDAES
eukprot:s3831_g1.t1